MRKITIRDVAQLAEVSTTTVSFVFNDPKRVNENTRKHVLDIAKRLGYAPNFSAVALRGKSLSIAVIINSHYDQMTQNPTIMEGLPFIAQGLTRRGLYFMPFFITPDDQENLQLLSLIQSNQIAGALFLASRRDLHILNTLIQKQIPLVVVGTLDNYEKKILSVDNDNVYNAYQATMLAYERGYKRIAYLSGDLDFIVCQQRLQGYQRAVSEKQLHTPIVYGLCEDRKELELAIKSMMESDHPDAIVVKDDVKGIYTINMVQKLGYTVGEDVGVIGIGGVVFGTFCSPQLTTIKFSIEEILENAIENLSEQIRTKKMLVGQHIIAANILDRGSLPTRK